MTSHFKVLYLLNYGGFWNRRMTSLQKIERIRCRFIVPTVALVLGTYVGVALGILGITGLC
ncbi:MAG: hypothetical protein JSW60_08420 [Thermoplasmatales archaeon]|nr:MAG: hypothetical protein JSW60_08420 [Thermoplasmatales archaeon]